MTDVSASELQRAARGLRAGQGGRAAGDRDAGSRRAAGGATGERAEGGGAAAGGRANTLARQPQRGLTRTCSRAYCRTQTYM